MAATPEEQEVVIRDVTPGALAAITRSELDAQLEVAQVRRREVTAFQARAIALATIDPETAAACFYAVPRDGKLIRGPSVRLAEICAATWGNLRVGARVIDEGEKMLTAQGWGHDLETNYAVSVEVRRRLTDKYGRRYRDDLILLTANAACSVAYRNAVWKVIPRVYIDAILKAVEAAAIATAPAPGEVADPIMAADQRAQKAVAYFVRAGVSEAAVLARLEIATMADFTPEHLGALTGLRTAIREGAVTLGEAFPLVQPEQDGAERLKDRVRQVAERPR